MQSTVFRNHWIVEATVIVGSILLALAADAWWSNTQERAAERELLQLLKSQFEENIATLDGQLLIHEFAENHARELLDISKGNLPWPGYEEVVAIMGGQLLYTSYDSSSGAVEAYLSSDNSSLLDNSTLQSALAAWPSLLQENKEDEIRVVNLIDRELKPFLRSSVPFDDIFTTLGDEISFGTFDKELTPSNIQDTIQTQEFANFMVERATLERLIQREKRSLFSAAEEILEWINLELDLQSPDT